MYPIFHIGNFFPLSWNIVVPIISVFILMYLIQSVLSFAINFIYWTQRNDNEKTNTPIQILIIFSPNCYLRYSNFFLKISCSPRYTVICIFFFLYKEWNILLFLLTEEIPRSEDLRIALITNQFIQYLATLPSGIWTCTWSVERTLQNDAMLAPYSTTLCLQCLPRDSAVLGYAYSKPPAKFPHLGGEVMSV